MDNNEILEMNKKEEELNEKLKYVKETVNQYKKQLQEYKESHPEEFKNKNIELTDIHAIGSIKALKIEIANRDALQEEKDKIIKNREEEKKNVQEKLNYVQETIKQYKKQLQEYKESHPEEFNNKNTEITDIHAIGSIKALKIEMQKEEKLQKTMKLLNFDEEKQIENNNLNEQKDNKKEEISKNDNKQILNEDLNKENYNQEDIDKLLNESKSITEEDETKTVNPILEKDEKVVNIGEGKAKIKFEQQELNNLKKEDDTEKVELNKEEEQISENNQNVSVLYNAVSILYNAKTDKYIVKNINAKEQKEIERKQLDKLDKNLLTEKMGQDINNVDTNIIQLLLEYDKQYKTTKVSDYINTVSKMGLNKKEKQKEMTENGIKIEYNLKGLYDRHEVELYKYEYEYVDNFSNEEKEELLSIANNAKIKGIATVKKGPKVTITELLNKTARKFSLRKLIKENRVEQIPEKAEITEQEELEKAYEKELKRTKKNKKLARNIEEVSKSQRETSQKSKNGYIWEDGNIVPKANIDHEQALNNVKYNKEDNEPSISIEEEK